MSDELPPLLKAAEKNGAVMLIVILSELITNSVLHSQSTVFALMFVDRYKTKSILSIRTNCSLMKSSK